MHEVNDELVPAGNVKKRSLRTEDARVAYYIQQSICFAYLFPCTYTLPSFSDVGRPSAAIPSPLSPISFSILDYFSPVSSHIPPGVLSYSGPSSLGAGPVIYPASPRSQLQQQDCSRGSEVVMTVRRGLLGISKRSADFSFRGMDRAWGDDYVVDRHCLGLVRWPASLWTRSGATCVVFHCCSEVGHLHGCSEALLVLRPRRMPGGPCSRRVEWTLQLQ